MRFLSRICHEAAVQEIAEDFWYVASHPEMVPLNPYVSMAPAGWPPMQLTNGLRSHVRLLVMNPWYFNIVDAAIAVGGQTPHDGVALPYSNSSPSASHFPSATTCAAVVNGRGTGYKYSASRSVVLQLHAQDPGCTLTLSGVLVCEGALG